MGEFGLDYRWEDNPFEENRQNVDMFNQDEIVHRAGIRDDQPHS